MLSRKRQDQLMTQLARIRRADRFVLLREAMDLVLKREGKDSLKDFDGVFFIYAGGRLQVARGSLYWPHKSNFRHDATKKASAKFHQGRSVDQVGVQQRFLVWLCERGLS